MSNIIILKQPQETIASRCGKQLSKIDQPISGQTNIAEQIAAPVPGMEMMDVCTISYDALDRIVTLSKAINQQEERRLPQLYAIATEALNRVNGVIEHKTFPDAKTRRIKELENALKATEMHLGTLKFYLEREGVPVPAIMGAAKDTIEHALAKGRVK